MHTITRRQRRWEGGWPSAAGSMSISSAVCYISLESNKKIYKCTKKSKIKILKSTCERNEGGMEWIHSLVIYVPATPDAIVFFTHPPDQITVRYQITKSNINIKYS